MYTKLYSGAITHQRFFYTSTGILHYSGYCQIIYNIIVLFFFYYYVLFISDIFQMYYKCIHILYYSLATRSDLSTMTRVLRPPIESTIILRSIIFPVIWNTYGL